MPSETYHLRREHTDHLRDVVESNDEIDNPSQAIKHIIDKDMGAAE